MGYFATPLISATISSYAVSYVAPFTAIMTTVLWTYVQSRMSGTKKNITVKAVLKSPPVIAFLAGIAVYAININLPQIVSNCVSTLAGMAGPVAMIVIGVFLAQQEIKELVKDKHAWICCIVRLIVIPAVVLIVLKALFGKDEAFAIALAIAAATPVAPNVAVFAEKQESDYMYVVKTVCISSVLSIITIPAMILYYSFLP